MDTTFISAAPLPLRNRASGSAGWIHIVPKGELPHDESGLVQVLDDVSHDSILRNIESDRASTLRVSPPSVGGSFADSNSSRTAGIAAFR